MDAMRDTSERVLIAGEWRPPSHPDGLFCAVDPRTREPLSEQYPVSSFDDIALALKAGEQATAALARVAKDDIARFLEEYARRIEARGASLVEMAARETGLQPAPRLAEVELPRTTDQLRQAAQTVRERSWCRATIDSKRNLRSMYAPLAGPIAIFGPSNFPFAFNAIAGGDFAAAIAAGNPVIAKGHPGHPGTTRMLAECAHSALSTTGLPPATVQLVYHVNPAVGLRLPSHPLLGATAFTGGKRTGLALKAEADRANKPMYLEMSSVNPVFLLPGALAYRQAPLAQELFESCARDAGQFCTKPALSIIIDDRESSSFVEDVAARFRGGPPATLLGQRELDAASQAVDALAHNGATLLTGGRQSEGVPGYSFANTLFRIGGDRFLRRASDLQVEAFGTIHLVIVARDVEQMIEIARALQGGLTAAIHAAWTPDDEQGYVRLASIMRPKVGRLLRDKFPTGVAVSPAMNHGGPFPATCHPGFTAVGLPASMLRFAALHCYDGVPSRHLPEELRDENPTGSMWRFIDGTYTQASVARYRPS